MHGGSAVLDQQNADIDPGGGSAPHEGLMLFWIPRLSVPVIIIYEQTTSRCWDDLITPWKAQKIHHRTKLAMFTTPAQTQDCVFSWLVRKSYTWVLSDCYIHIASGDFCLYNVTNMIVISCECKQMKIHTLYWMVGLFTVSEPNISHLQFLRWVKTILFYNPDWFLRIKLKVIQDCKICIYLLKVIFRCIYHNSHL